MVGEPHQLEIREKTPRSWRVTVDGRRVAVVRLPVRAWKAVFTGETLDDGACNHFAFTLATIRSYDGDRWGRLGLSSVIRDRGLVRRSADALRGSF